MTGRRVDVHVIAATNRSLRQEIAARRFRSDLYYRLNVIEIGLPPLCERREDIPLLVAAFARDCSNRLGKRILGTTTSAERLLASAAWDGNVRELRNVIERACILADTEFISEREILNSLPPPDANDPSAMIVDQGTTLQQVEMPWPDADHPSAMASHRRTARPASAEAESLAALERAHVRKVMEDVGWNKTVAATRLGVSRRALYRRLDRLGLAPDAERRGA
jgi:DNA-binding NtrC family response regulator